VAAAAQGAQGRLGRGQVVAGGGQLTGLRLTQTEQRAARLWMGVQHARLRLCCVVLMHKHGQRGDVDGSTAHVRMPGSSSMPGMVAAVEGSGT